MNGLNSSCSQNGSAMKGNGSNIPALRIQPDTPVPPSCGTTPIPPLGQDKTNIQLPALSTTRSVVNQGKPTQNGVTPRSMGHHQASSFFNNRHIKSDLNGMMGPMCMGINPRNRSVGHQIQPSNQSVQQQSQNLHLPNRLETSTPTPSEVSSIRSTPRPSAQTPTLTERVTTPSFNGNDKHVFLEPFPVTKSEWNPYKPLPHVQNGSNGTSVTTASEMDRQSNCSNGMIPSATCSLSPYQHMETSPSGSNFTSSPRNSAHVRMHGTKRALSISPIGSDGVDLYSLIRTSPTSLVAYINGSRSSSTSVSPQPGVQPGHFGHLIAHRSNRGGSSGSPYSGSGSSRPRHSFTPHSGFKREPEFGINENLSDIFPDIVSNQVVVQQSDVPSFEQRAMEDMRYSQMNNFAHQHNSQPNNTTSGTNISSNLAVVGRPPPPYEQAVQNPAGPTPTSQQQQMPHMPTTQHHHMHSSPPQQQQPHVTQPLQQHNFQHNNMAPQVAPALQPLSQLNTNTNNMVNNSNIINDNNYLNSDMCEDGELDENGEKQNMCRWIDCNLMFKEQDELVRHIEKAHIDQRKGEDFTCFWSGCQRRYKPFNARYKLLIHMRVHSGEKPNKCTFEGCNKAFSRLENLKIHLRSHTGERPYVCTHMGCTKAFSNSSDRAKHQRTHLDTKPYACQVAGCNKRYTDPSSLRKHVKNHNQKDPQIKKKMKKEGDSLAGHGMLSNCLTVQQLHVDNTQTEQQETRQGVTGPTTDLYTIGLSDHSPGPVPKGSPMPNSNLSVVEEEQGFGTYRYSPVPPPTQLMSKRPFPSIRPPGLPASMRQNMAQPYHDPMQQQYLDHMSNIYDNNNGNLGTYPQCGMDIQRANSGYVDFPEEYIAMPCAAEDAQAKQYLQHRAIDRCNSRLSAIYADGTN